MPSERLVKILGKSSLGLVSTLRAPRSRHYAHHRLAKASGGHRDIHALKHPRGSSGVGTLRVIQKNLLEYLYALADGQQKIAGARPEYFQPHDRAHGFVRGRSIITHARQHRGRRVIIRIDLEDFFPSIAFPRVKGLFVASPFGFSGTDASWLARVVTLDAADGGGLPQGAITSPHIANLVARGLDRTLRGLARSLRCRYSRYADDLTFSTQAGIHVEELIQRATEIIEAAGFEVNESKTMVRRRHQRQMVCGIVVNDGLNVNRRYIRNLRATLHNIEKKGLAGEMDGRVKEFRRNSARRSYVAKRMGEHAKKLWEDLRSGQDLEFVEAREIFFDQLMGRIRFVDQVARANECDTSPAGQERFRVRRNMAEKLRTQLLELKAFRDVPERKRAWANREIWEKLAHFKNRSALVRRLEQIRAKDPRALLWGRELQELRKNLSAEVGDLGTKLVAQAKKLPKWDPSRQRLRWYLTDRKNSQGGVLGRLGHDIPVSPGELENLLETVKKDQQERTLPGMLSDRLIRVLQQCIQAAANRTNTEDPWSPDATDPVYSDLKTHVILGLDFASSTNQLKQWLEDPGAGVAEGRKHGKVRCKSLNVHIPDTVDLVTWRGDAQCGFGAGLNHLLYAMDQHGEGDEVIIQSWVDEQADKVLVSVMDSASRRVECRDGRASRESLLGGDILQAIRHLYPLCDYSVVAEFEDLNAWWTVDMLQESVEPFAPERWKPRIGPQKPQGLIHLLGFPLIRR